MTTDYVIKKVFLKNCDDDLYNEFYTHNLGHANSAMRQWLPRVRESRGGFALYIKQDNVFVAWAMIFKHPYKWGKFARFRSCHIWVEPAFRDAKVGTLLVKEIVRQCNQSRLHPEFYPHDNRSEKFFDYLKSKKIITANMTGYW